VTVTVGAGRSSVTVTVGPGRCTVTVTVGPGTGTLTVTAGAGRTCGGPATPTSPGTVIATSTASSTVPPIASKAANRRFRRFRRCLLAGRDACGVITLLMVNRAMRALPHTKRIKPGTMAVEGGEGRRPFRPR